MIILSGGTGTPKLLRGLTRILPKLNIVVNTAEDRWVSGNLVCPDIDSVLYTLSGMIDDSRWWGIREDTFNTYSFLSSLGKDELLKIGDKDRAIHIIRSELIRNGKTITQATDFLKNALKINPGIRILPMTDHEIRTVIHTKSGNLHFQDFWVKYKGRPEVLSVHLKGIRNASPTREVAELFKKEKKVLIGPSNPVTSIGPILELVKGYLSSKRVVAISPIIGNSPVSGPAAKLLKAKGYEVSVRGVYEFYKRFLDAIIIDRRDELREKIEVFKTDILMDTEEKAIKLAEFVVDVV
jgi:LPPG:FO 2-phospho-L-lactate transferase